jgi:nucleotide-binding universal stress UspA family protein
MGTIVVGVDGSPGSDSALRWALAEARLRGSRVRVLHVYELPRIPVTDAGLGVAGGMATPVAVGDDGERLRNAVETEARALVDAAVRGAGADALEGLEIDRVVTQGPPAATLIESARTAELLVVGSRGRGGFLGLLLGSVSQQCAQHPPCPVVILPRPEESDAPEP